MKFFWSLAYGKMRLSSVLLQSQCHHMFTGRRLFFHKSPDSKAHLVSMAYTFLESTLPCKKPPILIMHGLLGSKMNWKSLGKAINQRTGRAVFAVDARNHGDSAHTQSLCYPLLADDILLFLQEHSIPKAVLLGHSMGGRAVMATALTEPSVVDHLIVVDISPFSTTQSMYTLPKFVEVMKEVIIPNHLTLPQARSYVDDNLKNSVPELGIRQFLLTNLIQDGKKYKWKVNIDAIAENFHPHISTFPMMPYYEKYFDGRTDFIGGSLSDYITPDDELKIRDIFPTAKFHYVEGAGHWLHADKPENFLQLISQILK